jgi:hypothetical protein
MSDDIEELKQRIVKELDEVELLDVLGLDISDLVELLEEQIEESKPELLRALG